MDEAGLRRRAREALRDLGRAGLTLACAESCTGGMVAAALTAHAGSSKVLERGFVTYSNAAKEELLGVPAATLARHGAVSGETARAMAEGALARSRADVALAVTGVAGPGGGAPGKPVGRVHIAACRRGAAPLHERLDLAGGRGEVRAASAAAALGLALRAAGLAR